jgi:hypothetical protein
MKLENPEWAKVSPGPLPNSAVYSFLDLACGIAAQARIKQDVFEDFKSYFARDRYVRSSTESDAESDLRRLMGEAADNAPRFIAIFADACADFERMGYRVPSRDEINSSARYSAFYIDGDTVVHSRWVSEESAAPDVPPEPQRAIVEFSTMKFGNPDWVFDSPGLIPRDILDETR